MNRFIRRLIKLEPPDAERPLRIIVHFGVVHALHYCDQGASDELAKVHPFALCHTVTLFVTRDQVSGQLSPAILA